MTVQRVNAACSQAPWRSSFPLGDDRFAGAAQVVVEPFPHGLNNWHATRRWRLTAPEAATGRSERSRELAEDRCAADSEGVVDGFLDHDRIQWLTGERGCGVRQCPARRPVPAPWHGPGCSGLAACGVREGR